MLEALLPPRALAVIGIVCLVLVAFAVAWAFFKVSYQKALGRPVPRFWLTNFFDVVAEIGNNLPGALNRALKLAGKPGLFLPTAPADGSPPTASAATIDVLSNENAALRVSLADYQRRVAGSHAVTEPTPFDPTARQTIAPDVAAQIAGNSQRGSVELGVAGFLLVLVALVAVGVHVASCVPVRRFVLDHTDGVPPRGPCVPTAQRCAALDGGVFLPVVCSADHREWPTHPLSPNGEQLTCAVGEGCEVTDAGIARCTAADGGVR
jgi:hypothetical protein